MRVMYQQLTTPFLTQYRVYDVIIISDGSLSGKTYKIVDDTGSVHLFSTNRFRLLTDIRAEKLEQLI